MLLHTFYLLLLRHRPSKHNITLRHNYSKYIPVKLPKHHSKTQWKLQPSIVIDVFVSAVLLKKKKKSSLDLQGSTRTCYCWCCPQCEYMTRALSLTLAYELKIMNEFCSSERKRYSRILIRAPQSSDSACSSHLCWCVQVHSRLPSFQMAAGPFVMLNNRCITSETLLNWNTTRAIPPKIKWCDLL